MSLPTTHVLLSRDGRISDRIPNWAAVGMKFGRANNPDGFLRWICYQWNSCCYLKKPITYSGGYYRVHTGELRCNYGAFALMGYNAKQSIFIKNDGQLVDFCNRPWWNWAYNVLYPVYTTMQELPGFGNLPERFTRCVRLILGGYGGHEVYTGLYFDPFADLPDLNRMLRRVGPELTSMWTACIMGLRKRKEQVVVTEAHTPPSPPSH